MMEVVRAERVRKHSPYSELFGSRHMSRRSRCSVIVAHPNDEIVGGGCLISKLPNVRILHVSDGAPLSLEEARAAGCDSVEAYAKARRGECLVALELARVARDRVLEWELPQLEAPYCMVQLTKRLTFLLQETAPKIVLTHAYEGGHPDHDTVAFAVHNAVELLQKSGLKPPVIFEMAIYPGLNGMTKVPEFLQNPARESTTLMLDHKAMALKQQMFECFKTQTGILADSPLGPEKFRQAPSYDFRKPPDKGKLLYETFDWGVTGEQWRALAGEALKELFPETDER